MTTLLEALQKRAGWRVNQLDDMLFGAYQSTAEAEVDAWRLVLSIWPQIESAILGARAEAWDEGFRSGRLGPGRHDDGWDENPYR